MSTTCIYKAPPAQSDSHTINYYEHLEWFIQLDTITCYQSAVLSAVIFVFLLSEQSKLALCTNCWRQHSEDFYICLFLLSVKHSLFFVLTNSRQDMLVDDLFSCRASDDHCNFLQQQLVWCQRALTCKIYLFIFFTKIQKLKTTRLLNWDVTVKM